MAKSHTPKKSCFKFTMRQHEAANLNAENMQPTRTFQSFTVCFCRKRPVLRYNQVVSEVVLADDHHVRNTAEEGQMGSNKAVPLRRAAVGQQKGLN